MAFRVVDGQGLDDVHGPDGVGEDPTDAGGGLGATGMVVLLKGKAKLGSAGDQVHPVDPPQEDLLQPLLLRFCQAVSLLLASVLFIGSAKRCGYHLP